MLQADEIIAQKEWHELNDAEKEILKDLVDTETTFYLLKKMLILSTEESNEVPVISSAVYESIASTLPTRKINISKYWYAAAALIVIALSAGLFLFKKDQAAADVVNTGWQPSGKDNSIKQPDLVLKHNVDSVSNKEILDNGNDKLGVQKVTPDKRSKNKAPLFNNSDSSLQNMYVIQTRVDADPYLLDFISEAE